jgi:formate C-acetyltransferase
MEEFNRLRARDVNVLSSLLLDGCIENAESATRGGCRIRVGGPEWMGLVTVIDSLTVIRQFVFEEQVVSMEELIRALSANWEGYGELRTLILKKASFFGNDAPVSNEMAQRLTKSLFALCRDRRLEMDVRVLCGNLAGYHAHYAIFGKTTAATPDGRHAGDPFMVGIGQSFGKDREGITALLSSVAGFDPCGIFCGPTVCNVMLDEATVKNDESFEKLVSVVDTYFKLGGLHIQTNYVSRETLLAARKNPEDFRTLKVRVSGFAGVYTELCEDIQEDILKRTPIAN